MRNIRMLLRHWKNSKAVLPPLKLGSGFIQVKERTVASLKSKNSLETLMKNIETEAKQIITASQGAFKTLIALLNGFIEGNKNSVYAPLLNWSIIQGNKNVEFRRRVEEVKNLLQRITVVLAEAEKIETDF